MKNFMTVDKIQAKANQYQVYINLVNNYTPQSVTQEVILEYAHIGNVNKVATKLNEHGLTHNGLPYTGNEIKETIMSKPLPNDELHKIIRSWYLKKTLPIRRLHKN